MNILFISPVEVGDEIFKVHELDGYRIFKSKIFLDNFTDLKTSANRILANLKKAKIWDFDYVFGFSAGANVAMELYSLGYLNIKKLVLDGYIYKNKGQVFKKMAMIKFKNYQEALLKGSISRDVIIDKYPKIYPEIYSEFEKLDKKSARNLINSLLNRKKYNVNTGRILFVFGRDDFCIRDMEDLKKDFSGAKFKILSKYGHANAILKDANNYFKICL